MVRGRQFTSNEKALAWMAAEFGDARARLDPATLDALEHYKGPGFAEINADLRDGTVDRFTAERWLAITNAIASDRLRPPQTASDRLRPPQTAGAGAPRDRFRTADPARAGRS